MDLPNNEPILIENKPDPTTLPITPKTKFSFNSLSLTKKVALLGGVFLFILFFLVLLLAISSGGQQTNEIPSSNPQEEIDEAKNDEAEKKQAEADNSAPINQLQSAYSDVVGSDSVKRKLEIDSAGVATIDYTVTSTDGQTVIKTSYENFADLASKIFNIPGVTRLNVTTYANKFTDSFGQPDQAAIKMQVTKETSGKINWPLKKFVYVDYATILDLHELNPLLQKDYENLTKTKKS